MREFLEEERRREADESLPQCKSIDAICIRKCLYTPWSKREFSPHVLKRAAQRQRHIKDLVKFPHFEAVWKGEEGWLPMNKSSSDAKKRTHVLWHYMALWL